MPMPNRHNVDAEGYRYAYQGQEKDPETGKEAFELRLWDSRIGRWLTTDPAGQYSSPYLGMGNNPVITYDKDGAIGQTDYVWTDSNGDEQSVHVNDGINQVVRINSWFGFLARGLANTGISDPLDSKLNQALIEHGTVISNTSVSFDATDLAPMISLINNNIANKDTYTDKGGTKLRCLNQVNAATSELYSDKSLNWAIANNMDLPGNKKYNNMNKSMQYLINIGLALNNQIYFSGDMQVGQKLYNRTTPNSLSVWGLSFNHSYHSITIIVDRTGDHYKIHFFDQHNHFIYNSAQNFDVSMNAFQHMRGMYYPGGHTFTQYQH